MGVLPGAPGSCPGAVEKEEFSRMTGLCRGSDGGCLEMTAHVL